MNTRKLLGVVAMAAMAWLGIPIGASAEPGDIVGFDFTRDSGSNDEEPVDVVVGASGKIYVLNRLGTFDYALQRFGTDGVVDSGFGTNGAIEFTAVGGFLGPLEGFLALAIDEDNGRALVGGTFSVSGTTNPRFTVRSLKFDGSFDTNFGTDGRAIIDTPNDGAILRMARDANGRIVLAGVDGFLDLFNATFTGGTPIVARLTADGDVDGNFTQTTLDWGGDNDAPAGVFVEDGGTILVTGAASLNAAIEFGERSALSRLSPNGGLDSSFGNGGTFVEDFEPGTCEDNDKVGCEGAGIYRALDGGQFLASIYVDRSGPGTVDDILIARFNGDGSLDASFDGDGVQRFDSKSFIPGSVPALLPDDTVVLAKDVDVAGNEDLRLYQIEGYSQIAGGGGNRPPVAGDDSFRVDEDSVDVELKVLRNDSDPDGDRLRIRGRIRPSARGTVTIGRRGLFYTPAPDFVGTETFSYTVIDGNGGSAQASVTVTVRNANNDAPVARNDAFTIPAVSRFNTLKVLRNDLDPDPRTTLTITRAVGRPANGRVRLTPEGLLQYRPNEGFTGTDSFGYEISDGEFTDRATVTITVGP